jgi:aspartyl-tRNA(Asn)/glutamyl-tRNA(Gln) amidotransferase subunit B
MRTKEELNDYRYFPDPDLSPLEVSEEWLDKIRASMPALPRELYHKYVEEFHLSPYDSHVLTDAKDVAMYFENVCGLTKNFKAASNWVMGPVKSYLNELDLSADEFPIVPETLV